MEKHHGYVIFLRMAADYNKSGVTCHCTFNAGVIFVNGWTDAPNAIATCVSTRSMGVTAAIVMSAVFNFFGVLGHDDGQCHRGNDHQQHG